MRPALLACLLLFGCTTPTPPPAAPPGILRPVVAIEGPNSHIRTPACHRIRSPQQFARVWLAHQGKDRAADAGDYLYYENDAGVPQLDFETHEVLAVFGGVQGNSGGIQAVEIVDDATCRHFRYDSKPFQTSGPDGGGVQNTVYGFFVLPKTSLPIAVEEDVHELIGEPRKWREQARLQ